MGPVVIGLSGGRTSAYLLRRVIDASGGALPHDVVPVFTDTGEELPATYRFIDDIERWWGVEVVRLRRPGARPRQGYAEYAEAIGRPIESLTPIDMLLEDYRVGAERRGVPFRVFGGPSRWCSVEAKHRTMERWALERWGSSGVARFTDLMGIRADEPKRARDLDGAHDARPVYPVGLEPWYTAGAASVPQRAAVLHAWLMRAIQGPLGWASRFVLASWVVAHCMEWLEAWRVSARTQMEADQAGRVEYDIECPLVQAGVTSADVLRFWAQQPFDLGIPSRLGNCAGCPMKNNHGLLLVELAEPGTLGPWARRERHYSAKTGC